MSYWSSLSYSAYISGVEDGPPLIYRTLTFEHRRGGFQFHSIKPHRDTLKQSRSPQVFTLSSLATMLKLKTLAALVAAAISPIAYAVSSQTYTWNNVRIGGGGGFVPGIVFNPTEKVKLQPLKWRRVS